MKIHSLTAGAAARPAALRRPTQDFDLVSLLTSCRRAHRIKHQLVKPTRLRRERSVTSHHLLQMFPQNVAHEIWSQIQESVLSQVAQLLSAHVELEEVDVGQTELSGRPVQPLRHVLLGPLPRVYGTEMITNTFSASSVFRRRTETHCRRCRRCAGPWRSR